MAGRKIDPIKKLAVKEKEKQRLQAIKDKKPKAKPGRRVDPVLLETGRQMYFAGDSQAVIAERCGVSQNAVSQWVRHNGWESMRNSATRIPLISQKTVMKCYTAIAEEITKEQTDWDKIEQMRRIADKFSVKLDIRELTNYSGELIKYANLKMKKEEAMFIVKICDDFVKYTLKENSNENNER